MVKDKRESIMSEEIADAINRVFMSPNVMDSNLEDANVVDVLDRMARAGQDIARAFNSKPGAIPFRMPDGGEAGDMTEGVIALAVAGNRIADAIDNVAYSIERVAESISTPRAFAGEGE